MTDYDRIWDEVYGGLQDVGPTHRHMVRIMRRLLAPLRYESVLDVGVGFGHNLPALTAGREGVRVAGVDVSQRAIDHVRATHTGTFERLDITSECLQEKYELVCCALVLEHLVDDEATLANMRAMCSGHLLLVTIGGDFERYRPWEEQVGHVRNYAPGELERKLAAAGFELVELVRWGFPLYTPIVRSLQNRMTVSSELSRGSRLIAQILYPVFFLNSARRGDLLVALAR
jgi:2-polyprenyl-3-methyl-5-hydroxy-6-metoxy-1,4-benzoquinol methylase